MFYIHSLYGICYFIFAIVYAIMIECLKVRGYIPENAYVKVFNLVSCLLLTGFTFYKMFTVEHQMCEFHYDCYGIETMHYYSIPYETYNECIGSSDFSNLIIDYEK